MAILSSAAWYAQSENLAQLIRKHLRNELSEEEKKVLDDWLDSSVGNRSWYDGVFEEDRLEQIVKLFNSFDADAACDRALAKLDRQSNRRIWWRAAAAVVVLAIGLFIYKPWLNRQATPETVKENPEPSIAPANEKVLLALADGSMIDAGKVSEGTVIRQDNVEISIANGRIVYKKITHNSNGPVKFNVLSVPRGKQFELQLADGSSIQLNSLSSIRFPVSFTGNDRRVELTGEAYFDVKSNAVRRFTVVTDNTTIQALSTKFNVKAYGDDGTIRTTLIEGKLDLVTGSKRGKLKSNQAAIIIPEKSIAVYDVTRENSENANAWTRGFLVFDEADAVTVMKHVERLYDVQVVYNDTPVVSLVGRFPQKDPIDVLLKRLNNEHLYNTRRDNVITVYKQPPVNTEKK